MGLQPTQCRTDQIVQIPRAAVLLPSVKNLNSMHNLFKIEWDFDMT